MYNVFFFIIILSARREQHSRKLKKSKITYWALAHANVDYRARSGRTISSISILRYVSRIDALFTAHTHNVRIIAIDCIAFCPRRFVRHIHKIIAFFCHAHGNGVMQFAIHSTSTVLTNQFFIRDSRLLLSLSDKSRFMQISMPHKRSNNGNWYWFWKVYARHTPPKIIQPNIVAYGLLNA